MDLLGFAAQPELAGIRAIHADEHFHQRRFSGAILADEGVKASGSDAQANVVRCANDRNSFLGSSHLQKPLGNHVSPPSACSSAFLYLCFQPELLSIGFANPYIGTNTNLS